MVLEKSNRTVPCAPKSGARGTLLLKAGKRQIRVPTNLAARWIIVSSEARMKLIVEQARLTLEDIFS